MTLMVRVPELVVETDIGVAPVLAAVKLVADPVAVIGGSLA
ncbi:MAG TPA: hypothetical protein VFC03_09095 [Acidimicrobiales bacterium]|nr:hypothetical protein [Acidimicrobiales bacterium]